MAETKIAASSRMAPSAKTKPSSVNVMVTGFGPYPDGLGHFVKHNASHLLTQVLPASLAPSSSKNPNPTSINIVNPTSMPHAYIKTSYRFIREYCRELHSSPAAGDIDLFIHIGEAYPEEFISVERVAYKQGFSCNWWNSVVGGGDRGYYLVPDVFGEIVNDLGPCPWNDVPMALRGSLDVDAVVRGAQDLVDSTRHTQGCDDETGLRLHGSVPINLADRELQPQCENQDAKTSTTNEQALPIISHSDGGPFCCGFLHYESLANCYRNIQQPRVLFCHIPGEIDKASMERARDGILAVIVSAVRELMSSTQ